jgi:CDP-glucose 4,6-dehydratase
MCTAILKRSATGNTICDTRTLKTALSKCNDVLEGVGMVGQEKRGFWQDRAVFVTGATGLLGSWLTKKLVEFGADVTCLVRDWVPRSELVGSRYIEKVKVVRGSVHDGKLLERVLGEYEIDTVFSLAAQTIVPIANRNPISTFETNIGGTWKVLEACRRSPKMNQIVVASSDKAYGKHRTLPYTEEHQLHGTHPYDVSKSCADLLAQAYAATFGLRVAITRCGNFFGGGDMNWNRVVPGTIRSVLRGQRPLIRSDGRYVRDYFYVEDAAAASILLAECLARDQSLRGEAFNFSYERPMSVLEIVDLILHLMQSDLKPDIRNEATGEIESQYLSAARARKVLSWKPLFALEEGLTRTIEWYRAMFSNEP